MMFRRSLTTLLVLVLLCGLGTIAPARTIYINNRIGNDLYDGSAPENVGLLTGPVKTFDRAVALLEAGDRLEIANNGEDFPYHDSLRLIGEDDSGIPTMPVIIDGNGAILDGSIAIPRDAWELVEQGLWRIEPRRKGTYRLFRGSETVPEIASSRAGHPTPGPGHWTAWRGAIYYQAMPTELPGEEPFRIAARQAGLFLYHVHHVIIRDLTVRHYHLDGVNAHDQAGPVILDGVRSIENARSGVFIGGTSHLSIRGGVIRNNRAEPILVRELGRVEVHETDIGGDHKTEG